MRSELTVAQLAELAGITVRTLHHYDQIGLLVPSTRSDAGYRLYGDDEVTRLREILTWRRLGVPLAEIPALLDGTGDRRAVLRRQRELVEEQVRSLRTLAEALDRAIADTEGDPMKTDQDIIDALGGFDPADHAEEAQARWGDTPAYEEASARSARYTAADWAAIRAEADEISQRLVALWESGAAPDSEAALEAAEAHRRHVTARFYECTPDIHRNLGEMYVADPRFTAAWEGEDSKRSGVAAWVRDAFAANADRLAGVE